VGGRGESDAEGQTDSLACLLGSGVRHSSTDLMYPRTLISTTTTATTTGSYEARPALPAGRGFSDSPATSAGDCPRSLGGRCCSPAPTPPAWRRPAPRHVDAADSGRDHRPTTPPPPAPVQRGVATANRRPRAPPPPPPPAPAPPHRPQRRPRPRRPHRPHLAPRRPPAGPKQYIVFGDLGTKAAVRPDHYHLHRCLGDAADAVHVYIPWTITLTPSLV